MHVKCKVTFGLPELNPTAYVECTMHITNHLGRYNIILGRDILRELGINLDFKENSITWGDYQTSMKPVNVTLAEHLDNVESTEAAAADIAKILYGKYQKVDLHTDIVDSCVTLSIEEKEKLLRVLQKHKELFNGMLGTWVF
eukprot:1760926-Ditylum_brightwellii.AAC.1